MSRYTGPRWKLSRRLGISLSGTGKEIARRNYAPGQHGPNGGRRKISEYGQQLAEKQKLRFMYDVNERQFRNLFNRAGKMDGIHGINLMILLETRLDNVVYRLGLASSRPQARQLVNHGHITVDGKRVDIPSYEVQVGQKISLREKSKDLTIVKENLENVVGRPGFVSFDENTLTGSLVRNPERDELEPNIDESLVVEYYNQVL